MVFEFLDFQDETTVEEYQWRSDDDQEEEEPNITETNAFWESLRRQLHESLLRRTSTEVKIQRDTEEIVQKIQLEGKTHTYFIENVVKELRDLGHNSAVCKSSWNASSDTPAGEHRYIDVITDNKRRIIIELNFKSEFETVRQCAEYAKLVSNLPEIFVGKADKLKSVVKIMCSAMKKCMIVNKMHMAPWRKYKYMQSKWLAKSERVVSRDVVSVAELPKADRQLREIRSILTFDSHCAALTVA